MVKRRWILACAALCLAGIAAWGAFHEYTFVKSVEIDHYEELAGAFGLDFPPEQWTLPTRLPLGAAITVAASVLPFAYHTSWMVLFLAAVIAAAVLAYRLGGAEELALYGGTILATILVLGETIVFERIDAFAALFLFAAWSAQRWKRPQIAAALLGCASLLTPVAWLFLPGLFLLPAKRERASLLRGLGIGAFIGGASCFLALSPSIGWSFVRASAERVLSLGIQVESSWSVLALLKSNLAHAKASIDWNGFSHTIAHAPEWLGYLTLCCIAAASVLLPLVARRKGASPAAPDAVALILLCLTLGFGPALAPQFLLWIIPIALAWTYLRWKENPMSERLWALALLVLGAGLLTQWLYPSQYYTIIDQSSGLPLVGLLLRNGFLIAAGFLCLRDCGLLPRLRLPLLPFSLRASLWFIAVMGLFGAQSIIAVPLNDTVFVPKGQAPKQVSLPYFYKNDVTDFSVSFSLVREWYSPTVFTLKPDDCIVKIRINDTVVDKGDLLFCNNTKEVNFRELLRPGKNSVEFTLQDKGGKSGLGFSASRFDITILMHRLLLLIAILGLIRCIAVRFLPAAAERPFWMIAFFGIALRIAYTFYTPFAARAYDAADHYAYIDYVLHNWLIPQASNGWEFHQAPLYYFVAAAWHQTVTWLGYVPLMQYDDLQMLSLAFSLLTLGITLWIATLIFPGPSRTPRLLFAALMSTFPTLVFLSSRITNDVLYTVFGFLSVGLFLRFWRTRRAADWYGSCTAIALGFLTKANAVLVLPAALLSAFWEQRASKERVFSWTLLLHSGMYMAAISGWLVILRFLEPKTTKLLSFGHSGMNPKLLIPDNWNLLYYVTFNPLAVFSMPFNNNWAFDAHREYFFEYLYRSAFFGEFSFKQMPIAIPYAILTIGMILLLFGIAAMVMEWRKPQRFTRPLFSLLLTILAATLVFRLLFGCPCDQDFRFAILTLVPLFAFLCGYLEQKNAPFKPLLTACICGLCLMSSIFLISLVGTP